MTLRETKSLCRALIHELCYVANALVVLAEIAEEDRQVVERFVQACRKERGNKQVAVNGYAHSENSLWATR